MKLVFVNVIWQFVLVNHVKAADDDYNVVHKDGSFEFGYQNPDTYHFADGNRNNVVRGEFGGRNPKTGGIDTTVYTAGPRGFRPKGKNVYRKYDLNQNGPRPIGSRDDPYYDPYEDPSYNFAFKTRTYSRQENANRVGDVNGRYTYLDDIGERHNVEYIAGKNTGFHVKTPFPDSNPRAYGPLYFRGRGRPIPRGRTSIQRGLDGSYKFVSAGPDQRRTEVSDSTGHVRGSYTYLDDKGVQHSVHYIAGPETGYRVLKTVKGAHLPAVFPFDRPEIIPPDFYGYGAEGDVFDTAASGRPFKPAKKPGSNGDLGADGGEENGLGDEDNVGGRKPISRPSSSKPSGGDEDDEASIDFGDLFDDGGSTTSRPGFRPTSSTGRPTMTTTFKPSHKPEDTDDGSYKPEGDDEYFGARPGRPKPDANFDEVPFGGAVGDYEGDSGSPGGVLQVGGGKCPKCTGTLVTNIGYKPFNVPPGVSVRAHVQSIDLYPYEGPGPSEAFKADPILKTEQLNEASSDSQHKTTPSPGSTTNKSD